MASENIMSGSIEDIIFENRNKSYGAYDIRKKYARYVQIGFAIAIGVAILVILIPTILAFINKHKGDLVREKVESIAELTEPPPTNKELPPPPEIKIPVPDEIKFVPPRVVEKAKKEEVFHENKEIEKSNVSDKDVKGDKDLHMTDPVKETLPEKEDNNVYNIVSIEKEPEFPGGQEALLKFVNSHINYPAQAQDMNVQGRVFIQFVVEKNGSISAVALNKSKIPGNDMGLIKEAIRVVNLIPPFKPGMQNGKPVRVNYILPINFKISSN